MPPITALHYVGYDDDQGGIVSVVRKLASRSEFRSVLGVNRGFVARSTSALATQEFAPLRGEVIDLRTWWYTARVAREAQAWLRQDPGRVFHGHSRAGLWVAWHLARRGERHVLASVHCYGKHRGLYRWLNRQMRGRIFWLTPAMKHYYGVPTNGWEGCVPPCIDVVDTPPAFQRPRGDRLVLGGAGSLVPWKRWDLVLRALANVAPGPRERIRFVHVGSPIATPASRAFAEKLQAATAALGLQSQVEWRGQQPSTAPLLREIDALVVASEREPCSVAMLEALAAGVPVVAADSGGNPDVIQPGRNGWLFQDGGVADLTKKLEQLFAPETWSTIHVDRSQLERFSTEKVASQWLEIYRMLVEPN